MINLLQQPHTDAGNGERFSEARTDWRYCIERRCWMRWNGRRWRSRSPGEVRKAAVEVIRAARCQAQRKAASLSQRGDEEGAQVQSKSAKFFFNCENVSRIDATIRFAESYGSISVAKFDADPWLLNCQNGTIDLRTGKLRPHDQEDFITKICPVNFDPNARCPLFKSFIDECLGGKRSLVDYLQRVIGYCLTGCVNEKILVVFFGPGGNNGKTTLLEAIRYVLNDYAGQLSIDTLTRRVHDNNSLADLADLVGLRFVTTSEAGESHRIAEDRLKYITGMGEIRCARKYGNPFSFAPTFKVVMESNVLPEIKGDDMALCRRLKPIAFSVSVPEDKIDKALLDKLKSEASGILAWAVRGCLAWQQGGLAEPPEIQQALDEWKRRDDPIAEFLDDKCCVGRGRFVASSKLYRAFEDFARRTGREPSCCTRIS